MPMTISVHPSNRVHLFSRPILAQHCRCENLRLHGHGKPTNDVVSIIWTGKVWHTYWFKSPWMSWIVDPTIVISLEFDNMPVDDVNGEGGVNACTSMRKDLTLN